MNSAPVREVAVSLLVLIVVCGLAIAGAAAIWFPLETMIGYEGSDPGLVPDSVVMIILGVVMVAAAVGIGISFVADGRERHRIAVVVVALVAALGVGAGFVVVTAPGGLPDKVYELDEACSGTAYDGAAPYAGPAPHPVAVFVPTETGQLLTTTPERPDGSVWEAADPAEPEAVQLVACGSLEREQRITDQDCGPYSPTGLGSGRSVPMVQATYLIRVYELRTHRELHSISVEGEDTDCPQVISADSPPDRLLSELSDDQWQSVLADLVNAELP